MTQARAGLRFLMSLIKQIFPPGKTLREVSSDWVTTFIRHSELGLTSHSLFAFTSRGQPATNHSRPFSHQNRNLLQGLRQPPRSCLWGRTETHRAPLLRQLCLAGLPRGGWGGRDLWPGPGSSLLSRHPRGLRGSWRSLSETRGDQENIATEALACLAGCLCVPWSVSEHYRTEFRDEYCAR